MSNSAENNHASRKEEILAKSRKSKIDEGLEHAQSKGNRLGEYTMSVVGIPLIIFAFFAKELAIFLVLGIVVLAFVFGQSLTVYRFTKKKYHLAWVVLSAIFTIHMIIDFMLLFQGGMNPLWLRWWMA